MAAAPLTTELALPARRRGRGWVVATDGVEVALTNLEKLYWGPEGLTKGDLVAHYWNVADTILPYLRDRPLTLRRMPEGADGDWFYAKNAPPGTPEWLRRAPVAAVDQPAAEPVAYLLADDRAALVWLANAGCIELHPWHARIDDLGHPDYAFFDLDPMGAATFADVRAAALHVRTILDHLGLRSYPRTSGATGMQVFVPIDRVHTAASVRAVVGAACRLIERADPDRTTMTFEIARRGDRVFLDHAMNTEGRNIAATYCLRPERGAPAATPLTWEEVEGDAEPGDFTIRTLPQRLAERGDLFLPVLEGGQDLRAAATALGVALADDEGPHHRLVEEEPGDLGDYVRKRDFRRTSEPALGASGRDGMEPAKVGAPAGQGSGGPPRFVIQHHLATRLHHDLRLERGGTLRSWALPKGLPEVPGLAHLAVHTEDHPLEYLEFSGSIPAGEYGGGEMRIWDAGTYQASEWAEDKATVRLHGGRHTGEYHLFRTGGQDAPEQWLVTRPGAPAERPPPPPEYAPMLASGGAEPFDDDRFRFELKWDGVRAMVRCERPGFGDEGRTVLTSRQGNDVTAGYPELAATWERVLALNAVLDAEIVALGPDGRPSFERLQQRMHVREPAAVARLRQRVPVTLVVFDLLAVDGLPLVDLALEERQERLDRLLVPGGSVVLSERVDGAGTALFEVVRERGLEGVMAKRRDSRYHPGRRSDAWRKIKVRRRALVVIGGWAPGEGARATTIGALVVGWWHGDAEDREPPLDYGGRVGTGFDEATLEHLLALLQERATDDCPFRRARDLPQASSARGGARWVRPDLVCAVTYAERGSSGRLRAPSFQGLVDVAPAEAHAPTDR